MFSLQWSTIQVFVEDLRYAVYPRVTCAKPTPSWYSINLDYIFSDRNVAGSPSHSITGLHLYSLIEVVQYVSLGGTQRTSFVKCKASFPCVDNPCCRRDRNTHLTPVFFKRKCACQYCLVPRIPEVFNTRCAELCAACHACMSRCE